MNSGESQTPRWAYQIAFKYCFPQITISSSPGQIGANLRFTFTLLLSRSHFHTFTFTLSHFHTFTLSNFQTFTLSHFLSQDVFWWQSHKKGLEHQLDSDPWLIELFCPNSTFWPIELAPILTRHKRPWKKIVFFRLTYLEILFEILLFLVGAVFVGSATTKIGVFLSQKGPNGFVCLLFVSPCNTVFHKSEYLDENFLWRAGGVYTRSELSVGEYASISRHCRPPINDPWKITPD